jgi:MraZ protein
MQGSAGPARGVKFLGSYQHQLDEKGRVSLPAPFRREAADQRFVLVQPYPPALALYPDIEWNEVQERLAELQAKGEAERLYVLQLLSTAVEVSPDGQGRILIPGSLKKAAGLESSVLLVGAINKVELWAPEQFQATVVSRASGLEKYTTQLFR